MVAFQISVVLLLLLSGAVEYSSCERFNIVPSPDSHCPGEFTGEPCITLQQYVANPSLSSNITLEVHPGNHSLDSELSVSNIDYFTMRANTLSPPATVTCDQQVSDWHFHFNRLQQIHIGGITFVGCEMRMDYITNATLEKNSMVNRTRRGDVFYIRYSSVQITQCIFSDNKVYRGIIYSHGCTIIIEQSSIRNDDYSPGCCDHRRAMQIIDGNMDIRNSNFSTNVAVQYSNGVGGVIYASGAVLTITKSFFSDNRAETNGGAIYFDGGNITIIYSTFINNTASGGGGGAIYLAIGIIPIYQ